MNHVESIRNKIQLNTESKTNAMLFSEGFKVIGLGFMTGQKLARHSTPVAAFLFVVEGSIEFTMGGSIVKLEAGDFIAIPPNEEHEVLALKESRILLTKGV